VSPAEQVEIVRLHFDHGGSVAQPQEYGRPFADAERVVDERVAIEVPDCGQRLRLRDT
jgi:hypothetical protein